MATAAGGLFGNSDIAIKRLVHPALTQVMLLVSRWTLSALIVDGPRLLRLRAKPAARPGDRVITFTSLTANTEALLGGIVVFHDPIGHTPPQIAPRLAALRLVILGAALLPGRHRARRAYRGRHPPRSPRQCAIPQQASS